jgi:hypothetical protein
MTERAELELRHDSPPWKRRSGCATNKLSRSILGQAQTGWFVQLPTIAGAGTNHPVRACQRKGTFSQWPGHPSLAKEGTVALQRSAATKKII